MSDLISRSALLENFRNNITEQSDTMDWIDMIARQQTAYDLESVIEQIKNIKTDNSCTNCKYKEKCDELEEFYNPSDDVDLCALTTKHLALEIIKYAMNCKNGG